MVYSLGVIPAFENEVWCGVKHGKLLLYDLEKDEVVFQNNKAHCINDHKSIFRDEGQTAANLSSLSDGFDVNAISATSDINLLATGADDGLIKLWDRRIMSSNAKPVGGFIGH